ncbi:MAG: dephospho-CoA kinase [Gemmatimonadetes bacterium]|nr:dephospho-CoA kinase [Gemmatimonadota bacterium]
MLRVGLTGNIASGKSTVARLWAGKGAWLIDADELARRAVAPGSQALARIVHEFGPQLLDAAGELDRAAMRRIAFGDAEARRRLEAIVHPEVGRLRAEEERCARAAGARVVVHDIPLLFEVGLERDFDVLVLVDAPAELRLRRLMRARNLSEPEARAMLQAQMPAAEKRARADYVIQNDGTLEQLAARAEEVWQAIAPSR